MKVGVCVLMQVVVSMSGGVKSKCEGVDGNGY